MGKTFRNQKTQFDDERVSNGNYKQKKKQDKKMRTKRAHKHDKNYYDADHFDNQEYSMNIKEYQDELAAEEYYDKNRDNYR